MNEFKMIVVATVGGVMAQPLDPLAGLPPVDSVGEMVARMVISIIGGVVSTLLFKLIRQWPLKRTHVDKVQEISTNKH